jgi:hypothetical protein
LDNTKLFQAASADSPFAKLFGRAERRQQQSYQNRYD